jgi:hypothetical protein
MFFVKVRTSHDNDSMKTTYIIHYLSVAASFVSFAARPFVCPSTSCRYHQSEISLQFTPPTSKRIMLHFEQWKLVRKYVNGQPCLEISVWT